MKPLQFSGVNPTVIRRTTPFFEELLKDHHETVHSIHLVGSAVTEDFHEKHEDINSVIVLNEIHFGFMRFLGSLGSRYRKDAIAAPLIMTPVFIENSLDAFPIEFLDFKTIHKTVFGNDIFSGLTIDLPDLRLQCKREMKTRLIGMRQGYISSLGKKELLTELLSKSVTGCMPLFRGIITLLGKQPPVRRHEVVKTLENVTAEHCEKSQVCVETEIFEKLLALKHKKIDPSEEDLHLIFKRYYGATEILDQLIDELHT